MGDVSEKILKEIDERGIEQVPAWRFTMSSVLMWVGLAFFMLFGSLSVSVMLALLSDNDWSGMKYYHAGPLAFVFSVVPYAWLGLLVLLIVAAYADFRRTEGGHRYRTIVVVLGAVMVSLLAGGVMHAAGVGSRADQVLEERVRFYDRAVVRGAHLWNKPEEGHMIGCIRSVSDSGVVELVDPSGRIWSVSLDGLDSLSFSLSEGMHIRLLGQSDSSGVFRVEYVLPWRPMRRNAPRPAMDGIEKPCPAYNKQERSKRPQVHPAAGIIRPNNPEL
jgi:hypothetical protein